MSKRVLTRGANTPRELRVSGEKLRSGTAIRSHGLPAVADRCDEEAPMHTQTTETFQHVSDEKLATLSRGR
jgi:hypothetical protein